VRKLNKARTEARRSFRARDARNADQLFDFPNECWHELNQNGQEYLEDLIKRMPKRMQAAIDQNGGWTG